MDVEKFSNVALFEGLSSQQIAGLLELAEDMETRAGHTVVEQGSSGEGFYIIAAGAFEVRVKGNGQQDTRLVRLEELSHFGEMSLVSNEPRSASVVCVEDGRLKKIPSGKFKALLDTNQLSAYKVILNMSRIMAQRLRRTGQLLVDK